MTTKRATATTDLLLTRRAVLVGDTLLAPGAVPFFTVQRILRDGEGADERISFVGRNLQLKKNNMRMTFADAAGVVAVRR